MDKDIDIYIKCNILHYMMPSQYETGLFQNYNLTHSLKLIIM